MNRARAILGSLIAVGAGLAGLIYLLGPGDGILCWAAMSIIYLRLAPAQRHRQWPLVVIAIAWSVAVLGLSVWISRNYQRALQATVQVRDWLQNILGLTVPSDVAGAIIVWNAAFLAAFVAVKLLAIIVLRLSESPTDVSVERSWPIAYRVRAGMGWVLRPWWRHARWLCWSVATLGAVATAVCWLTLEGNLDLAWLPLLPAAAFLVGSELGSWLGGRLDENWQPVFEETDSPSILVGQFTQLWERYRKKWSRQWLSAGNLQPERHDDVGSNG